MLFNQDKIVPVVWTLLSHLIFVSLATYTADYRHFTWDNIAAWGVYALLGVLEIDGLVFFIFVSMQTQVILGVVLMSATGCSLFINTYRSVGLVEYTAGDFIMHFAPLPLAILLLNKKYFVKTPDYIITSIWLGYAPLMTWTYVHDPWEIYGCTTIPVFVAVIAPFMLATALTVILPYFFPLEI